MKPIRDSQEFISALEVAIKQKDKKQILELYEANDIDWWKVHFSIADRYNELVEEGNLILGV